MLHIQMLGDFSIKVDEDPLTTVNKPRLQSLLTYLIIHRDAPQFRYHLANILWPESSESQAHTNLRNLVHLLRRALPDGDRLILATNQTLQWNPEIPVQVDVIEFQSWLSGNMRAISLENLEAAFHWYRGDLLTCCYDEWINSERANLRHLFLNLLSELCKRYENLRRYPEAITCTQHLIELEPLQKDGYLILMRLYALLGDAPLVQKTYRDYANHLKRELGTEPEADIRELYTQMTQGGKKTPTAAKSNSSTHDTIPLVGRTAEWQVMQTRWKIAAGGNPGVLILSGEAGIGKTRLAEELVNWAAKQGIRTATAHCYSSEGSLPYTPVMTWLRTLGLPALDKVWQTELSRLLPELLPNQRERPAPLTEAWQRMRLFEALARAALDKRQKTLLLIDDLQWGDQDTLEWLHYLLRFDPTAPLLVVGTVRSEEASANSSYSQLLTSLQQEGHHLELELGPLNEPETRQLADHVAGKPLEGGIGSLLFHETEGNPLFIVETVRVELFKTAPLPGVQPLPFKVRAVLENRIRQLSPQTREIAMLAATIGRAFSMDILSQAGGIVETDLVKSMDDLLRRRIVREIDQDTFLFSHEKLRQAVFVDISAPHRRLLHRQVAEALNHGLKNDPGTRYGEIASHYEQAGSEEEAVHYYLLAAKKARELYANDRAIQYYERARALCEAHLDEASLSFSSPDTLASLYEELGDMLTLAGKYPQAESLFEKALSQPSSQPRLWRAQIYRKISITLVQQFKHPQAHDVLAQAEQSFYTHKEGYLLENEAGTLLEKQEWIQIQLARCDLYYWGNHPDQMDAIIQKIRALVDTHGRPDQRIELLSQQYMARLRYERYRLSAETVQIARHKLELIGNLDNPYNTAWAQFHLGFALLWHGEPEASREWIIKAYDEAVRMGARLLQVRTLAYLSVVSRKTGDKAALIEQTNQLLELAAAIGETSYVGIGLANQGWMAWHDGDLIRAEQLCKSANETWEKTGGNMFHWLANWVLLSIAVSRGDLIQAERHAQTLVDPSSIYQPLEEPSAHKVNEALSACQAHEPQAALNLFSQAVELAKSFHNL